MGEGNEFDWVEDDECVAVKSVLAIAVYENATGDIVVREEDRLGQDVIVSFPKANAQAIIDAIQALIQPQDPMSGIPTRAGFSTEK